METKCPTLWKPKKKLCYLPSTEGPTEKGDGTLTLLDVDRMFDDLDSPSHDLLPSPPVCDTFDVETNRRETSFSKAHMPMRTSSPIENNTPVKELDIAKDQAVSPILFACDDDRAEEARRAPPPHQKPQCNGDATEESEDFVFGCPPSKVVIPKPKKSIQKNKVEGACKESQTIQINPPQEPQTPVVEVKRKTPRKEIVAPPAAAESRESELASPEKTIENVAKQPPGKSIRSERELEAFLKRLRDTAQSKPACLRKSPVKSPCPPSEPEDEFLILEDEVPIWISIPTKSASNKKRLKKEPSNESEKEEEQRKTSKETREEEAAGKIDKKALNSKTSKTLKDAKTSRAKPLKRDKKVLQGSNGEADEATRKKGPSSEEVEAADLGSLSDEKIMPPETQTEEDSADAKTDENNKPPVVSKGSSSDDSLVLGKRKSRQPGEWWMEHRSPERTAVKSNQPTVKRAKQKNKQPSAAAVASPVRAETDKDTDYQPTIKKYKKPDQEPCGAAASPAKGKKDKVVKKRNQTRPAPSSSHKTNKAKEKKQNKKTGGQTRGEEMHTAEADHSEEQQEEGEDQQSSPLVFSHRDLSNNSGDKLFQKIFQPVSSEKKASTTPAPASPRGKEPLSAGRRSRRCPGSWWMVNDKCENVESVSSRPQQQEVKPQKERKKRIRTPPTPKNGNTAALSETPARSAAPLLEPKALSSQKKVKASLAAFKNIFSSTTKTSTVGRVQKKRQKAPERPVEEIPTAECTVFSSSDEAVETAKSIHNSPPQLEVPGSYSEDQCNFLSSGPASMIELEQYEEDDSLILPTSRVQGVLSMSDLYAPPLKPLTLEPKDKANLAEWFTSLWALPLQEKTEVLPDHFEWYSYQGRAIGFMIGIEWGSYCNGKMLLGSFMKKPLWVDHSAATVFNLLTGSVIVTVNGRECSFNPGKTFTVPCGSAYSLQNVYAQPAILYLNRIRVTE